MPPSRLPVRRSTVALSPRTPTSASSAASPPTVTQINPTKDALLSPDLSPSRRIRSYPRTPLLDDTFDTTPFSESFSALLEFSPYRDDEFIFEPPPPMMDSPEIFKHMQRVSLKADASYYVEQLSNIRDIDSDWEDDDVAEVMVVSHNKRKVSKLPALRLSPEEANTSPSSGDTPISQITQPPIPQQDVCTILRTLQHTPTSSLYLTYFRNGSPPYRLYTVRAYRRPLSRQGHAHQRTLQHITTMRVEGQNPYLQKLCRSWEDHTRLYLVTQHCEGGNLLRYIQARGVLDEELMKTWATEISSGLAALHDSEIVHCALRPSVVLIRANGHILISGFENSSKVQEERLASLEQERKGEWFHAPELLLGWEVGFEVDWWAYGIALGWMACGQHPFHLSVAEDVHADIMRKRIMSGAAASVALEAVAPTVRDLIKKCLERNPAKRLDMAGIKTHAWFTDIDWVSIARYHGPDIAISSPMPCYPSEDSPARPIVLIPPMAHSFIPQHVQSSSSDYGELKLMVFNPAQLERTHSMATIGTMSTGSSHMHSAVLTRATRTRLPTARPFSLAVFPSPDSSPPSSSPSPCPGSLPLSNFTSLSLSPAVSSPVRLRPTNPSPASTVPNSPGCMGVDTGESTRTVGLGLGVDEFGAWSPEHSSPCHGRYTPINVACGGSETVEDEARSPDELSITAALALPIPVLVFDQDEDKDEGTTEQPKGQSGRGSRLGRVPRNKLRKRRRETAVSLHAHDELAEGGETVTTTSPTLPEIDWHGLDEMLDPDPFRASGISLPRSLVDIERDPEEDTSSRDRLGVGVGRRADATFRWSALSLDVPRGGFGAAEGVMDVPPRPVLESTSRLSARLGSRSRALLKKSRESLRASSWSRRSAGCDEDDSEEDEIELGAGVRKMGRGIGYTRTPPPAPPSAPVAPPSVHDPSASRTSLWVFQGEVPGCYTGLNFRKKKHAQARLQEYPASEGSTRQVWDGSVGSGWA